MPNLFEMVARPGSRDTSLNQITLEDWATMFQYAGNQYTTGFGPMTSLGVQKQEMGSDYGGMVTGAYKGDSIVFSCMLTRMQVFSEARFQFRAFKDGRPGKLFGTQELGALEAPWPNGTTGDLLTKAIVDVDLAGNFYAARNGNNIRRLRPDWMTIVLGSNQDPVVDGPPPWDADPIGYLYQDGGPGSGIEPIFFNTSQICHWAPIPDPQARYRGMSWLTPITNEILGDKAMNAHKLKFFEHGATPNVIVTLDPSVKAEMFSTWVEKMRIGTEGLENAYKTMYLGGGATSQVVGTNLRQVDFKDVQSFGETRICAAAGVPPIIVGIVEGLKAATYSNYVQARRSFADGTLRPLWRSFCSSLAAIITEPSGAKLWYDDRDIPLLQQDQQDLATIQLTQASTLSSHIASGYTPESAIAAVLNDDLSLLAHSGLTSVQLQAPGSNPPAGSVPTGTNIPQKSRDVDTLARLLESRRLALESGDR